MEQVSQEECKVRFTLRNGARIIKHALAKKPRYLEDEETARVIFEGTYEIPGNLDDSTRYILDEIDKMGMKIRNKEGEEIMITPEDFCEILKKE